MSWLMRRGWLIWAPAAVLSLVLVGCGGDKKTNNDNDTTETGDNGNGGDVAGEKKAVKADGTGTIVGKVTLAEGFTPDIDDLNKKLLAAVNKDRNHCLSEEAKKKGDTKQQVWLLGKDGGVGNVVVFVKPEKRNEFFAVPKDLIDKAKAETKTLDQPFCAFEPHVTLLFPQYHNAKGKLENTGQVFRVINSAPIDHNTKWTHVRGATESGNVTVPKNTTGEDAQQISAVPSYTAPITLNCNVHQWMTGYAWALEHPYAAVTDENGNFKIENVPAGVKLRIVAWHETGFLKGRDGEVIEVKKDAETPKNFEVKKK